MADRPGGIPEQEIWPHLTDEERAHAESVATGTRRSVVGTVLGLAGVAAIGVVAATSTPDSIRQRLPMIYAVSAALIVALLANGLPAMLAWRREFLRYLRSAEWASQGSNATRPLGDREIGRHLTPAERAEVNRSTAEYGRWLGGMIIFPVSGVAIIPIVLMADPPTSISVGATSTFSGAPVLGFVVGTMAVLLMSLGWQMARSRSHLRSFLNATRWVTEQSGS